MTIAQGLRHLGLVAAVLVAAIALVSITMMTLLDREQMRASIEAQMRSATGLDLSIRGGAALSLFPAGSVTFHDIKLGSDDAPALVAETVTANLQLIPLMMGRFEVASLVMERPNITLRRTGPERSNWTPFVERLAERLKTDGGRNDPLSDIGIKDGVLLYRDDSQGISEMLTDIDVSLAWPSISRSFAATGDLVWRGERIDGSVGVADFAAMLGGKNAGLRVRLTSAPLKLAFDGALADRASKAAEGTLTIDSPSLRDMFRWSGHELPSGDGFGRFSLKARANFMDTAVSLANVNVELDGNSAEGIVNYGGDGRRRLQGTLAAETLDLTPYITTVKAFASNARDWNRQAFDVSGLSGKDIDLRVSASKIKLAQAQIGRSAFGVTLRDGAMAFNVGEAQVYGGIARGSFAVSTAQDDTLIKTQFQLSDVDLASCLSDLIDMRKLSGRGNINVDLQASGASPFELAQTLSGRLSLVGQNGSLSGFNAEQLLKRLQTKPLSAGDNLRSGRTLYEKLNISVRLAEGLATMEDITMDGPSVRMSLSGISSVPAREFDLKGVASLISQPGTAAGFDLPFVIQGPWDEPLIFPDPDTLLRRAPASAPLLDAVRDRRARDTVRSAIERLKNSNAVAEPQNPQPID